MIDIRLSFPDLAKKLKANETEIYKFVAAQIQTNRGMLFDREGAYNGHDKWAPLAFRQGQILSKRGVLRKSLAPINANGTAGSNGYVTYRGDEVTVGTNLFYAAMMNYGTTRMPGGVMRPTKAKALMIPIPGGKEATAAAKGIRAGLKGKPKFIFRKYVRIPARVYNDWNQQDQDEISEALMNKIIEVLSA